MRNIFSLIALIFVVNCCAQTIIIPPEYGQARGFSDGFAAVEQQGKWGFIDRQGNIVIPLVYKDVRDFHEGKAAVKTDNGWGYINRNNELIIPDKYFDAMDFSEGFAAVRVKNDINEFYRDGYDGENKYHTLDIHSWIYIRHDGKVAFDGIYRDVSSFHDGVACVFNEDSWEYINSKGESASPVKLDNFYPAQYSDGLIPNVGGFMGDEWGYTDIKGKWRIPPQYRRVSEFNEGIAAVEEFGGQMKVIDNTGTVLYVAKNESLILLKGGFILDGQYVFNKTDYVNPYHVFDDLRTYSYYWGHNETERPDIVMVPSGLPAGVSASVGYKPYANIQSVDVQRELKATLFINPCDGLWATQYDNYAWGFTALNMNEFINKNVESRMRQWLRKGEFESTAAYESRTSDKNRRQKMVSYADELVNSWLKKGFDKWTISNYDADRESFVVTTDFGKYTIKVPSDSARLLKTNWGSVNKRVGFRYDNGLYLDKIDFIIPTGNTYATLCVNTDTGTVEEYDHKTEKLPNIEWLEFMSNVTTEDCPIKLGVISKSKIEDFSITVNGAMERGIQTISNDSFDLTVYRTLKLNEGSNVIRVSVRNAVGTTQDEKMIVYRPQGKELPSIEWLEFTPTADNRELQVKLGIKSKTRIESVAINGEQTRGIKTVQTDEYDMIINRKLPLKKGENRIFVSVRNAIGISTSENVMYVNYGSVYNDKRIALVIGNSHYMGNVNSLSNPGNDAADVSLKLESLGFDVMVLYDATKRQMNDSISSFVDKAKNYDVALFYYAGHGLQLQTNLGGYNYLIPVDAELKYKSDAEYNCLNANQIVSQMELSGCKMRLVMLDACRDLPYLLDKNRGSNAKGFAEIKSAVGTFIMYSTREGESASDGIDRNSPFAEGVLKYMDEPNLPIETFFKKVGDWVDQKTDNNQSPWSTGRIKGDFFFNPK